MDLYMFLILSLMLPGKRSNGAKLPFDMSVFVD